MSWASKRKTTRIEDVADCLVGIFGVSMPTLYGEGENAFVPLQHEILKSSDDQTNGSEEEGGLLARSPAESRASGRVHPYTDRLSLLENSKVIPSFSMTNYGLNI